MVTDSKLAQANGSVDPLLSIATTSVSLGTYTPGDPTLLSTLQGLDYRALSLSYDT